MTDPSRIYTRHVCAAHQSGAPCCPAHGRACPLRTSRLVEPGSLDGARAAERARSTLANSPTLWVQTAHVAGPVAWHGAAPGGSVVFALSADNPLVTDVRAHERDVPAVLAATELGPAGVPDRVLQRAWLAGWLREAELLDFDVLTQIITGPIRGPHVTRRMPNLTILVLKVAEVLLPEAAQPETILSVDLTDYALAGPEPSEVQPRG